MKKIGLCICFAVKNYGSMLQAYATQQYIKKLGLDYEIIQYNKKHDLAFYINSCLKLFNSNFRKEVFRRIAYEKSLKKNKNFKQKLNVRNLKFEEFQKSHFSKLSDVCSSYLQLQAKGKELPAYLVGSDQLWLPAGLSTNFYNLNFTDESAVRISYATSFGVSKIPFYQKKRTAAFLQRMQYLSVREQRGVEIVSNIAEKKAELVVDPTLLLTANEWASFIPKIENCYGDYIFVYFIGNNPEHRQAVIDLRNKTGLRVVALTHIDEFIASDEGLYDETPFDVGPSEFVNLIRNAKYVCTDSFHGSVFSIIHEKQFVIFDRFSDKSKNSTNARICSLCSILGLTSRRYTEGADIYEMEKEEIDYNEVKQKLNGIRKSSIEFLNCAFAGIKD